MSEKRRRGHIEGVNVERRSWNPPSTCIRTDPHAPEARTLRWLVELIDGPLMKTSMQKRRDFTEIHRRKPAGRTIEVVSIDWE